LGEEKVVLNAILLDSRQLNDAIRKYSMRGVREIVVKNCRGQRYIGTSAKNKIRIIIHGYAGNDLGAFMERCEVIVYGNAGSGVGNTMNSGRIVVHGCVGDVLGYGMRGGEIFVKGDTGYRPGIGMKGYMSKEPVIVVGGSVGDFLCEYAAGGIFILLNISGGKHPFGRFVGTGMHGGKIFVRGGIRREHLTSAVLLDEPTDREYEQIERYVKEYMTLFGHEGEIGVDGEFVAIRPKSHRPYGELYTVSGREAV